MVTFDMAFAYYKCTDGDDDRDDDHNNCISTPSTYCTLRPEACIQYNINTKKLQKFYHC